MDAIDKEFIEKIRKNTLKKRLKAKTVSVIYPDRSYIEVSNYFKIIGEVYFVFILNRITKSLIKQKWIEVGKITCNIRNL